MKKAQRQNHDTLTISPDAYIYYGGDYGLTSIKFSLMEAKLNWGELISHSFPQALQRLNDSWHRSEQQVFNTNSSIKDLILTIHTHTLDLCFILQYHTHTTRTQEKACKDENGSILVLCTAAILH